LTIGEEKLHCNNINSVSFKGAYKIKGSTEILDEICWFLQKKKKNSTQLNFDFLDIRLVQKSQGETDKLLKIASREDITSKEVDEAILNHLLDLISIRNGKMKPFEPLVQKDNVDLFLTQKDKEIAERNAINMVEDSLVNVFRRLDVGNKVRVLLENLAQMREGLYYGKPISNIKAFVTQSHLNYLKIEDMKPLKAEDVLEKIQSGSFDIINGAA
jgi:hypothetical protein